MTITTFSSTRSDLLQHQSLTEISVPRASMTTRETLGTLCQLTERHYIEKWLESFPAGNRCLVKRNSSGTY